MQKITLTDLQRHYKLNRQELARFLLLLFNMPVSSELHTSLGSIKKLSDSELTLSLTSKNVAMIIKDLSGSSNPVLDLIQR